MSAKKFPFICGCGYNTMDAKSASEHIATCPRLVDDPDPDTPKPSHTATPWRCQPSKIYIIEGRGVSQVLIDGGAEPWTKCAEAWGGIFEQRDANAEHIVKCVNSHESNQAKIDALVGALKVADSAMTCGITHDQGEERYLIMPGEWTKLKEAVQSALNQAGEDV